MNKMYIFFNANGVNRGIRLGNRARECDITVLTCQITVADQKKGQSEVACGLLVILCHLGFFFLLLSVITIL